MANYLQVAGSHLHQFAEFKDGKLRPVQLWAICDGGEDGTELAGLVFHENTGRLVRADNMIGFKGYQDERHTI